MSFMSQIGYSGMNAAQIALNTSAQNVAHNMSLTLGKLIYRVVQP